MFLRSEPLKIADYNAFLSNGSVNEKIMAARDLGNMSSSAIKSIPKLVAALESDSDHEVKMEVIRAIERIGGDANLSVPSLVNALNDTRPEIRWAAAGALVSFGKKSVIAVPALVNLLDDEDNINISAQPNFSSTASQRVESQFLNNDRAGTQNASDFAMEGDIYN